MYLMKVIKHPYHPCEKVITHLNLITDCTTFSSNNCSQTIPIIWYESFALLWKNFTPLFAELHCG